MIRIWLIIILLVWVRASFSGDNNVQKLPIFDVGSVPEKILLNYPLGVIDMKTAYAHHGEPEKQMLLANGKEGWVYSIGYKKKQAIIKPSPNKYKTVDVTDWEAGIRNFTLVFDKEIVTDVIYKDDGPGIGVTAMELQYQRPEVRSGH
ncbi:MAG: hypothetical protein OQK73_12530 [Gammaproteobacteria bacterium]|nr:hypothetical protein [Gammaproteobacteria bacterium]